MVECVIIVINSSELVHHVYTIDVIVLNVMSPRSVEGVRPGHWLRYVTARLLSNDLN